MNILLLGEYSNVHATLADGLRQLGNSVTLASNGDFWKDYPRDIDLSRTPSRWSGMRLMAKLAALLPRLRGFDVVQLINPMFLELKAQRIRPIYRWLRRHNGKMVLGAFGMDYYWVHENITRKPLRYSDFNFGETLRIDDAAMKERKDWIGTPKQSLNELIANDCDGIVTGLYEYDAVYRPLFPAKTRFIPFPVRPDDDVVIEEKRRGEPVKVFIGISKGRSAYKGTDIMLAAAQDVQRRHPGDMELLVAEGLPFDEYVRLMRGSDAILDQLYSYTPAMNALEAMSHGIIVIGGGEPENYKILGEKELKPILNVEPNYHSVVRQLEWLVTHPGNVASLKRQSVDYIQRHHNYIEVARRYVGFYEDL